LISLNSVFVPNMPCGYISRRYSPLLTSVYQPFTLLSFFGTAVPEYSDDLHYGKNNI